MASDVMSVRLWLPRIKVEGVVVDAPEELDQGVGGRGGDGVAGVARGAPPHLRRCGVPSGKVA